MVLSLRRPDRLRIGLDERRLALPRRRRRFGWFSEIVGRWHRVGALVLGLAGTLLLLSGLVMPVQAGEADTGTETFQILYTNDIESVYEPLPATWRSDMTHIGGLGKGGC